MFPQGSVWDGLGYIITIITFSLFYNIIKVDSIIISIIIIRIVLIV